MRHKGAPEGLPAYRFPVDPWRLVETEYSDEDLGTTETTFALGNGYLGMRANPEEGRNAHSHGTYLNGFHETWQIRHAEDAYGFAKTGQTIVNVPDAKLMKLYVNDEPLLLGTADLQEYERSLDFRTGILTRHLIWRTPAGQHVQVDSTRMVSFVHRHLAVLTLSITPLEGAPLAVSSQLLNRQDGVDEYYVRAAALGEGQDPRRARRFTDRVLEPNLARDDDGVVTLGYRCRNSGMTLAVGYFNQVEADCETQVDTSLSDDLAKTTITAEPAAGQTVQITKYVTYHSSRGVPTEELADRCERTVKRAVATGSKKLAEEQKEWLDEYWHRADVVIEGDDAVQQAMRWNLFQLAQATGRAQDEGVAAKGVTAGGYDGHYFWDTEVYVVPFLCYTDPESARRLLRFRWRMLDAARARAKMLNERGALYPWRTINGEEASAYYAAGTAQYHINAAVVFALHRYLDATGDVDFLAHEGAEILIETARLWIDLGFWSSNGRTTFHIHRVTGPDEYTTVVNDNMYTNVMARFNLRYAARAVRVLREWNQEKFDRVQRVTGLELDELDAWDRAADSMYIPFDEELQIHPQDEAFLDLEPWDWAGTSEDRYPLLLHYHPLVIYRHQVLKQADVVLAMFLRSESFDVDQTRRNFDYYDPITTGDSSLSACVQAVVAAMVGYEELALNYFKQALFLDLCDLHGNTSDGVHVASAGGVWAVVVNGFAGMSDHGTHLEFRPRLPQEWESVSFRLIRHGSVLKVELDHDGCELILEEGSGVPVRVDDEDRIVTAGEPMRVPALA